MKKILITSGIILPIICLVYVLYYLTGDISIKISEEWYIHNDVEEGYQISSTDFSNPDYEKYSDIGVDGIYIDSNNYIITKYESGTFMDIYYYKLDPTKCYSEKLKKTYKVDNVLVEDLKFIPIWKLVLFGRW